MIHCRADISELDSQQHQDCPYFHTHDNPVFELVSNCKGTVVCRKVIKASIIFVTKGKISFSGTTVGEDEFFMLPAYSNCTVEFLESGTMLYFYIPEDMHICWQVKQSLYKNFPRSAKENLVLTANDIIKHHINLLSSMADKGFLCTKYMHTQLIALLDLICITYDADALAGFFSPLRSYSARHGIDFKDVVLQNKNKIFKVSEFAAAAYMSKVTFRRRFEQVFGMTPQEWITQERKKLIEDELKYGVKPLSKIATKAGFPLIREFYGFCKKSFGKTAKEIRNSKNIV
jgi:AraC-like DNA-binding protein